MPIDTTPADAAIQAVAQQAATAAVATFRAEMATLVLPLLNEARHAQQNAAPISPSIIRQLENLLAKVTT